MTILSTERYDDHEQAWRTAFAGLIAGTWTAEPGKIMAPLANDGTTTVQLLTLGTVTNPTTGASSYVPITPLQKVPVKYFGGNGLYITHPIAVGDECLVVFARRAIDNWWQSGGLQKPFEPRMHDINDGFCIPGFFSKPNAMQNVSMMSIQIRTQAGDVIADVTDTLITLNKNVMINANLVVTGNITGENGANYVDEFHTHNVRNVQSGSSTLTTTTPNPGT